MASQPNFFAVAAHIATKHEAAIGKAMAAYEAWRKPLPAWPRSCKPVGRSKAQLVAAIIARLHDGPATMPQLAREIGCSYELVRDAMPTAVKEARLSKVPAQPQKRLPAIYSLPAAA